MYQLCNKTDTLSFLDIFAMNVALLLHLSCLAARVMHITFHTRNELNVWACVCACVHVCVRVCVCAYFPSSVSISVFQGGELNLDFIAIRI